MRVAPLLLPIIAFAALAGAVLSIGVLPGDAWLGDLVQAHTGPALVAVMHWINYAGNWRASTYLRGSPGRGDPPAPPGLLLNEIAANTGPEGGFDDDERAALGVHEVERHEDRATCAPWPAGSCAPPPRA